MVELLLIGRTNEEKCSNLLRFWKGPEVAWEDAPAGGGSPGGKRRSRVTSVQAQILLNWAVGSVLGSGSPCLVTLYTF